MSLTINSTAVTLGELLTDGTDTVIPEATVVMSEAESVSVLIEDFGGIEEVRKDTYGRLHTTVSKAATPEAAVTLLDEAELIFIRNNFSEEKIKAETKKNGSIKRTKFLPNDYMSAKSVLLGCLEKGIPLFDEDGNPMGKSALSDKRAGKVDKTPQQKLTETLSRALKLAREVHGEGVASLCVLDGAGFAIEVTHA